MRGHLLKKFLIVCERKGLLQLNASMVNSEHELECLWESVQTKSFLGEETYTGCIANNTSLAEETNLYNVETPDVSLSEMRLSTANCTGTSEKNTQSEDLEGSSLLDSHNSEDEIDCLWESVSSVSEEKHTQNVTSNNCLDEGLATSTASLYNVETPDVSLLDMRLSTANCGTSEDEKDSYLLDSCKEQLSCSGFTSDVYGSKEDENITSSSSASAPGSVFSDHLIVKKSSEESEIEESFSDNKQVLSDHIAHDMNQSKFDGVSSNSEEYCLPNISLSSEPSETSEQDQSRLCSTPVSNHVTAVADTSDSDDDDDKLEKLFSDLKIRSEKRNYIPSRKSLDIFIVSDSEQPQFISSDSDDDVNVQFSEPPTFSTSCTYPTPYTPTSGIVFWGSPIRNEVKGVPKKKAVTSIRNRPPLVERQNFFTPINPPHRKCHTVQPLTTPSSCKFYPQFKNNMLKELQQLFNETVFDNKLSDVEIVWSKRLRTSAGICSCRTLSSSRRAVIQLSTKVCDSFDRLRDTLLHEMCHAACWIINGKQTAGHGPLWKEWADKAQAYHPGVGPVTRCHNYQITYKYTYQCVKCDFKMGRHSKSVKLQTARCPYCISELELAPRLNCDGAPTTKRKLNKYAKFIKDNYNSVKQASRNQTHAQVLEKINQLYHSAKDTLTP